MSGVVRKMRITRGIQQCERQVLAYPASALTSTPVAYRLLSHFANGLLPVVGRERQKGRIMTVGEVCNRDVIIAKPETPLPEAATLMKHYHVGDLVIVDTRPNGQRTPVGIVTDRDIALAVATQVERLPYLHVRDLMRRDVVTALDSESLHTALKKMQNAGIRRLPVVTADGVLEGIVTLDDIIELLSEELADLTRLVIQEQK